jgi:hypothetical protein
MGAVQTSVAAAAIAFDGMLADADQGTRVESRIQAEASAEIPFGKMCVRGATNEDTSAVKPHTSAAASAPLLCGVVVHDHTYAKDTELGDTGLKPGTTVNLLQRGRIYVTPEDDVDPGDAVKVRVVAAGAEVAGSFRAAADATDCVDISKFARWITTGSSTKPAVLEIDMVGASMATADT